jgi:hypothetical protein
MTKEEIRKRLLAGIEAPSRSDITILQELVLPPSIPAAPSQPPQAPEPAPRPGEAPARSSEVADGLAAITRELAALRTSSERQNDGRGSGTRTTVDETLLRAASGTTLGQLVNKGFPSLTGGLPAFPLISGLFSLFRGGPKETPDPLSYYVAPPTVQVEAGITRAGNLEAVSYGSEGLPRVHTQRPAPSLPPITIQVQTLDSRSFQDHSHEIARAVREAILTGHSLNDVVSEL